MKVIKKFISAIILLIFSMLTTIIVSCSSEKNEEGGNAEFINELKANKWISREASYDIGKNDHAWIDLESTCLYFTSNSEGVVYWIQKDYDTDLGNSINNYYDDFTYSVIGNQITIQTQSSTSKLIYAKDYLTYNGGIYEKYAMDSGDYNLLREISPKSGNCGNNLRYIYFPKTRTLKISGEGNMNDYSSLNQPWHDFYIESVIVEDGCTYIGKNAFSNKLEIGTIELPNSLVEIGGKAFSGTTITKVSIPDGVTIVGADAFYNCKYLQTVYLSKNLERIGGGAFVGCAIKYQNITLPDNVEEVGDYAFSGWQAGTLTLNDKLKTIGNGAFTGVKGTLTIPNSVESIGAVAFDGTFSKVIIGTGLKTLSRGAFGGSLSSGSMYVNLGVPLDIDGEIMASDNLYKWTLYVPKGSKKAYQANKYWKGFKSIIEDVNLSSGNGTPSDDNANDDNENQVGKDEKEQNAIDAKDNRRGNVSSQFSGNGTKASPYLIKNAADLRLLSDKCREGNTYKDEYFKLTSDIIINRNVTNSRGECNSSDNFERWIPIGCFEDSPFCGTFDGNGHTVNGVFISRKVRGAVGLFGYLAGNIRNLTIKDSYIENIGHTAGFVGKAFYFNKYKPQIEFCVNYAVIKGTDGYAGGLVGNGKLCNIFKSKNYGSINTNYFAGGIAGFIHGGNATIQNCVNYGNITGDGTKHPCIGGIVAVLGSSTSASYVYNCINKGSVTGNDTYEHNVSGITCLFYKGKISNCVNSGKIQYNGKKGCSIISNNNGGGYSDTFYLETAGKGVGTSMTEKQMKASSFLEKLNANSKTLNCSSWIVDNDGFPTLKL